MTLYHGSLIAGIRELEPVSSLHGTGEKVVYLSGNRAYALLYIWDGVRNRTGRKHVTCAVKNGIAVYEEQFPDQLAAFYKGVGGYLYYADADGQARALAGREAMYYSREPVTVKEAVFVPDVYEELLRCEKAGQLKLVRYEQMSKEWLRQLREHLAGEILEQGLLSRPGDSLAEFYRTFFPEVWDMAERASR